jgi:alpha-L-rhamnosidase
MGATTIWERWDSMLPNGSVNPGEMTSFNHYALGAVADWLHRTVGGLAPAQPGYRQIAVRPRPGGGLTHASARHLTPYGIAECSWIMQDGKIEVKIRVPPNTTAVVSLPGKEGQPIEVQSGTYSWSYAYADPDSRGPLSLDHTIGEISDDPAAWAALKEVIDRLIPENGFILYVLRSQSKRTLRDGLATLPNADAVLPAVSSALENLNTTVETRTHLE